MKKNQSKVMIFTIANDAYLPQVEMLYDSLINTDPDFSLKYNFQWIRLESNVSDNQREWSTNADKFLKRLIPILSQYSIEEACTAIKARVFKHFFRLGYENVIYLDPDIYFYRSFDFVMSEFSSSECGLTPHLLVPYKDKKRPNLIEINKSGIYNLGFIYLKNTPQANNFVDWWGRRKLIKSTKTKYDGVFTDQKWCECAPVFIEKTKISHNKGLNYAYWNMHERPIKYINHNLTADDSALIFIHFSGIVVGDNLKVSKHSSRGAEYLSEVGFKLYATYAKELENRKKIFDNTGWTYEIPLAFSNRKLPEILKHGLNDIFNENPELIYKINTKEEVLYELCRSENNRLPRYLLTLFESRPDVYNSFKGSISKGDLKPLNEWIQKSGKNEMPGIEALQIIMPDQNLADKIFAIYNSREDLQKSYPYVFTSIVHFSDFFYWIKNSAENEYGIKIPKEISIVDFGVTSLLKLDFYISQNDGLKSYLLKNAEDIVKKLTVWLDGNKRLFNVAELKFLKQSADKNSEYLAIRLKLRLDAICFNTVANMLKEKTSSGIVFSNELSKINDFINRFEDFEVYQFNYFSYGYACSGLGTAARGINSLLINNNHKFKTIPIESALDFERTLSVSELIDYEKFYLYVPRDGDINFYHYNLDVAKHVKINKNCFNAIYPIWELEELPSEMGAVLLDYDVVFAASEFVSNTFKQFRRDINLLPHRVLDDNFKYSSVNAKRRQDNKIYFGYFFDISSVYERKNPLAVIEAFENAFGVNSQLERLILKINRSNLNPTLTRDIIFRVIDNSSIELIFENLSESEMERLWAKIDVYVSLHKSEGFGLTLTESMLRNKYLITTNYGGLVDQLKSRDVLRVDFSMTNIGPNNEPYPAHFLWAEPNIESASAQMRIAAKKVKSGKICINSNYITKYFSDNYIIKNFYIGMNSMMYKFNGKNI